VIPGPTSSDGTSIDEEAPRHTTYLEGRDKPLKEAGVDDVRTMAHLEHIDRWRADGRFEGLAFR
jgi:hypothetical protein